MPENKDYEQKRSNRGRGGKGRPTPPTTIRLTEPVEAALAAYMAAENCAPGEAIRRAILLASRVSAAGQLSSVLDRLEADLGLLKSELYKMSNGPGRVIGAVTELVTEHHKQVMSVVEPINANMQIVLAAVFATGMIDKSRQAEWFLHFDQAVDLVKRGELGTQIVENVAKAKRIRAQQIGG